MKKKDNSQIRCSAMIPAGLATIFLICSVMLAGCSNGAQKDNGQEEVPSLVTPQNVELRTVTVHRGDINVVREVYGDWREIAVVYPATVSLGFEIDGTVSEVYVERGSYVTEGMVLAELDEEELLEELAELDKEISTLQKRFMKELAPYQEQLAELQKAYDAQAKRVAAATGASWKRRLQGELELQQIALERFQAEYNRLKESQEEQLQALQERYEEKENLIGRNQIIAPCDGVVVNDLQSLKGSTVKEEQLVIAIADQSKLYVDGPYYSQTLYDSLAEVYVLIGGQKIAVEYVPLTPEEEKQMQTSNAQGADNKYYMKYLLKLAEGQTVHSGERSIFFAISQFKEDVLVLPKDVVQNDNLGRFVYKFVDGIRVRTEVIIGLSDDNYVEILEGLEEGDEVYAQY